jgi:hypothetical protein
MKPTTFRTGACCAIALACALAVQPSVVGAQGTGWTIQPTPMRGQHSNGTPSSLSSVSCFSTSSCIASGQGVNRRGYIVPLADVWNGTAWGHMLIPNPTNSVDSEILGMSCLSATSCLAVGFGTYPTASITEKPIAERWDGSVWTVQVGVVPVGSSRALFNSVSCISTTQCSVVGEYSSPGSSTPDTALAEVWIFGSGWHRHPVPSPSGATAASLNSVVCSAASACTAVGYYVSSTSQVLPLVETWNGRVWTAQSAPGTGQLNALACTGAAPCMAVGCDSSTIGCAGGPPLVELWDGTSWTLGPAPDGTYLQGVSCSSGTTCTAVGLNGTGTFATAWDGTSWTDQATPNPSGSIEAVLNGIVCLSVTSCEAVGHYQPSVGLQYTLAEVFAG